MVLRTTAPPPLANAPEDVETSVRNELSKADASRLRAVLPYLVAAGLVLPLFAAEVWTGFRVALSDSVLGVLAASEQPLSLRAPGGQWAIGLALAWFALAYWQRRVVWWEGILVVAGATAAMLRAGNAWLDAVALIAPLGARLSDLRVRPALLLAVAAGGMLYAGLILWTTRPPAVAQAAIDAAASARGNGTVFADWRWAPQLQSHMNRQVLAAGGLGSESSAFWLNYVRINQDYEDWPTELRDLNADVLVLNTESADLVSQIRTSSDWHVVYDAGNALVAERAIS
jgi:hypothetical protein